jgi:hypothetical protein
MPSRSHYPRTLRQPQRVNPSKTRHCLVYAYVQSAFFEGMIVGGKMEDIPGSCSTAEELAADAGQTQKSKLRFGYDGAINAFSVAPKKSAAEQVWIVRRLLSRKPLSPNQNHFSKKRATIETQIAFQNRGSSLLFETKGIDIYRVGRTSKEDRMKLRPLPRSADTTV